MLFARWGLFFTKQRRRRYAYFQKTLHCSLFTPIFIIMLYQCMLLRQYKNSLAKAQIPAYFQKILDTRISGTTITQQLRRKNCSCPDKRAAFSFRQHHHYFFSSIFADGKSGVSVFTFTHRRYFAVFGVFCALGMQRSRFCKHIINTAFYRRSRPAVWFDSG